MYDHYIDIYRHHSKSTNTNTLVDEVADGLNPTRAEWLKMAKHAQKLEIQLAEYKKRISDYEWRDSPGQGMYWC